MSIPNCIAIHPTVVDTFHSKTTNVNLMVALDDKSNYWDSFSGNRNVFTELKILLGETVLLIIVFEFFFSFFIFLPLVL